MPFRNPPRHACAPLHARVRKPLFPVTSLSRWCGEKREVPGTGDRDPGDLRSGNPSDPGPALPIGEGISTDCITAPLRSDKRCVSLPPKFRTLDDRRSAPAKSRVGMNSPKASRFKPHFGLAEGRSMPAGYGC